MYAAVRRREVCERAAWWRGLGVAVRQIVNAKGNAYLREQFIELNLSL